MLRNNVHILQKNLMLQQGLSAPKNNFKLFKKLKISEDINSFKIIIRY